jgi:hypothetical protein
MGSLEFLIVKFGDLGLQGPESSEVIRSGTGHLPLAPVRVGLINRALHGHGLGSLGEMVRILLRITLITPWLC